MEEALIAAVLFVGGVVCIAQLMHVAIHNLSEL